MTTFTRTWDAAYESAPADSQDVSLGATRIREVRVDVGERLGVDHSMNGDANDGAHVQITLLEQASDPTNAANTGFLYTKDDGSGNTELYYEDDSGNVSQLTAGGSLVPASTTVAGIVELATKAETETGTDTGRVIPVASLYRHLYVAKAWGFFSAMGTTPVTEDQVNMADATRDGTGVYTFNLSNAMNSTDYCVIAQPTSTAARFVVEDQSSRAVDSFVLNVYSAAGVAQDCNSMSVLVFGNRDD